MISKNIPVVSDVIVIIPVHYFHNFSQDLWKKKVNRGSRKQYNGNNKWNNSAVILLAPAIPDIIIIILNQYFHDIREAKFFWNVPYGTSDIFKEEWEGA